MFGIDMIYWRSVVRHSGRRLFDNRYHGHTVDEEAAFARQTARLRAKGFIVPTSFTKPANTA